MRAARDRMLRHRVALCLVGAAASFGAQAASVPMSEAKSAALDSELRAIVEAPAHPLASLSVLAVRDGAVVYQRAFGARHIDAAEPSRNRAAQTTTLYRVASISKLITTLGVMRLIEEGKLALDDDVSKLLGFPLRNPAFPEVPITLGMLLDHTSSLRDDAGYYWDAAQNVHLRDVLVPGGRLHGSGAMWDRAHAPGSYFQYCNLAWGVVGSIMERATGERFDRLMQRLVFTPLGLRGGFHPADFSGADLRDIATLYRKRQTRDGRDVWDVRGPWVAQVDDYDAAAPEPRARADYVPGSNGTLFGPQGNARMSVEGLGRVMRMLLGRGSLDGVRFLRPETVALMLRQAWRLDASGDNGRADFGAARGLFNAWGLGNQHFLDVSGNGRGDRLVPAGGWRAKGHLGDAWGLTAAFVFDPEGGSGMIYLIGGVGFDPATYPGRYSGLARHEELILDAIHRHAIR